MNSIDTSKPVLVTGATGYVAGWIIKRLLEEGVTVHATVRDLRKVAQRAHLDALAAELPGTLRYFQADLLEQGAFRETMQGCQVVFHTASPFTSNVEDPQRDLIDPAVLGTRNVLSEATRVETVTRVVVTSSCAAIYGDSQDLKNAKGPKFSEADWNETSSVDHQPYSYSKLLAERAAWEIAEQQDRFRLVTVNPSLVLGPSLNGRPTSESFNIMKQLLDGTMKSGAPDLRIGVVDVRDVAEQHLRAGFFPNASGRYVCSAHDSGILDIAASVRRNFGTTYPVPTRALPKWLLWLVGPVVNKAFTRQMIAKNVGWPWSADSGKAIRELDMQYRPIDESTRDMVQQMVRAGLVEGSGRSKTEPPLYTPAARPAPPNA